MVGRPPIETWNRAELEDKYLKLYTSDLEIKKKNKSLENELKKHNTKLRKKIAGGSNDNSSEHQITINALKHEKEILMQKITALKQQLLAYTTPQMRQVGLSLLTSRPTNMATLRTLMTTGERHSAKMIIGTGKWGNKPIEEINNQQNNVKTKDVQSMERQKFLSNSLNVKHNENNFSKQNKVTNDNNLDKDLPTPGFVENVQNTDKEICSQLKVNYIKVNRELRSKNIEVSSLQKQLEDKILMINNLQQELNSLVDENTVLKKEKKQSAKTLKDLEKKIQLNFEELDTNTESSPKVINDFERERNKIEKPLLEAEIRQLKDEIYSLKEINEKLIKNSFEQENCGKVKIDQLNSLKGTIETLNEKIEELKDNNEELEKRIQYLNIEKKALEKHLINSEHGGDKNTTNIELKNVLNELSQIKNSRESKLNVDKNVNDLFTNINNMMEKYAKEDGISDNKDFEYKKMYEEVHEEMEKLRNLLVLQHNINEKQLEEIELLKMNNRLLSEELTKRKKIIEENNTKHNLEMNKLKGEINKKYSLPHNIDVYPEPFLTVQSHEVTTINEMSVILKGIQFNEGFITNSQTVYFISLEFFNFEILTTPTFSGVSCSFEYTAIYDLIVSELLVYYLQNEGIHIELYKVVGSDCTKLGSGVISLKSLVTTPKILESDVVIYSINGKLEIGSVRYNVILTDTIFECIKQGYKNLYFNDNITIMKNNELSKNENMSNITYKDNKTKENMEKQIYHKDKNIKDNKNNNNISITERFLNFNESKKLFEDENTDKKTDKQFKTESSYSKSSEESKTNTTISKTDFNKDESKNTKEVTSTIKEQHITSPKTKDENSLQYLDNEEKISKACVNVDIYSLSTLSNITKNPDITTFIVYQIPGHSAFISDPVKGINPVYNSHKEWNILLDFENINNLANESIFVYIVDADKCSKTIPDNHIFDEAVLCYAVIDVKKMELNRPMYGDYDTYLGNGKKSKTKLRLAVYMGERKEEKDFFEKSLSCIVEEDEDIEEEKIELVKDNISLDSTTKLNEKNKNEEVGISKTSSTTSSDTRTYIKNDSLNENAKNNTGNNIIDGDNFVEESTQQNSSIQLNENKSFTKEQEKIEEESFSSSTSIATVTEMNVTGSKPNFSLRPIKMPTTIKSGKNDKNKTIESQQSTEIENSIFSYQQKSYSENTSARSDKTKTSKSSDIKEVKEQRKGVGFMSPLHYSISPSNSYTSHSSLVEDKKKNHSKKEPSLYDIEKMKNIKPITHSMKMNDPVINDTSDEGILTIYISSFSTTENFYYIYRGNIEFTIFFEWQIIDINQELCETQQSLPVPRYANTPVLIDSKNEYVLSKRQVELLEQWQELGNKLTFAMVSDPGDEGECDDIGTASMDLQYINLGHLMELKIYTNEGDWVASIKVEVNLQYK